MEQILPAAEKKNTPRKKGGGGGSHFAVDVLCSQREVALCCTEPHRARILTVTINVSKQPYAMTFKTICDAYTRKVATLGAGTIMDHIPYPFTSDDIIL